MKKEESIVKRKRVSNYSKEEQKQIKKIQPHFLVKELKNIDFDILDDETYSYLMECVNYINDPMNIYQDGKKEVVFIGDKKINIKPFILKKAKKVKPRLTNYIFEKKWYEREVSVEGSIGFVIDYEDYINGNPYYKYDEDSYERKNWRTIEY